MRQYLNKLFGWRAAVIDLRGFMATRRPHQYGFAALSVTLVGLTIWGFWHDSKFTPEYHPDIVYVQSWPTNRTDAEIIAQQRVDEAKRRADEADLDRRQAEHQAQFKRLDDKLRKWGI